MTGNTDGKDLLDELRHAISGMFGLEIVEAIPIRLGWLNKKSPLRFQDEMNWLAGAVMMELSYLKN